MQQVKPASEMALNESPPPAKEFKVVALSVSNCFLIVEETPASYFLADTNHAGGPTRWQEMRKLPRVVEVRRDSVDRVYY